MKVTANRLFQFARTRGEEEMLALFDFVGGSFNLVYASTLALFRRPFYFHLFAEQCVALGVRSSSLVFITAVSTGMVMSIQFGFGLERFGGKLYVPKVTGLSILRELGPVLTCLMLAGRVGSGIAAEIGSMKVTQQIDAIRALGTDPLKRIVIPRILAMMLMTPILTIIADFIGILAGMFFSVLELNIPVEFYFHEAIMSMGFTDFLLGVAKTLFFGFIISVTGCYYGLNTKGGTQGVGSATTRAVVTSSICVTIFDFILTKVFWIFEKGLKG